MTRFRALLVALTIVIGGAAISHAHVALVYPTGGESFTAGDNVDIQWMIEIDHGDCDWDLYFSTDNGATWTTIVENLPKANLDYNWTVPNSPTTQGIVRVVQDNYSQPIYDSWSGALTVQSIAPVPTGSVWTWGILAILLAGGAMLALRTKRQPAKEKTRR